VPTASRTSLGGLIRLVHPFPILLDAVASAAVVLLAGGEAGTALRLGVGMLALQASIGALNDLLDAQIDAGRKPGKPIPAGLVAPSQARAVVVAAAGLGFVLAAPSGPVLLVIAALGLGMGYLYDLLAKRTAWSWLPFALGLPLLPVYGWYGAVGRLPEAFVILVPAAILAGAALAVANALADVERDRAAGVSSVAIRFGPGRAWAAGALLQVAVGLIALASLWVAGAGAASMAAAGLSGGLVVAGLLIGRGGPSFVRERAWELQAVGIALLAVSWLWGIATPA
jgi:4-hydroxybenzoate polyprenyltransferase